MGYSEKRAGEEEGFRILDASLREIVEAIVSAGERTPVLQPATLVMAFGFTPILIFSTRFGFFSP